MEDMFISARGYGGINETHRVSEKTMPLVVEGLKTKEGIISICAWHRGQDPTVNLIVDAFDGEWREV